MWHVKIYWAICSLTLWAVIERLQRLLTCAFEHKEGWWINDQLTLACKFESPSPQFINYTHKVL